MTHQEFYHEGKKGQKWGQRNYQNKDGTWTALGKARRRKGIASGHKESLPSRIVKRARLTLGRGKNKKTSGESNEDTKAKKSLSSEEKRKIVESGDAKLVQKHAKDLSTNEIQEAINKINKTKQLNDLIREQEPKKKSMADRIRTIADVSKSVAEIANSASNMKSAYDKIKDKEGKEKKEIDKIVKSGDLDKVINNLSRMTEAQVKNAKSKIEADKDIKGLREDWAKADKTEKTNKKIDKIIRGGDVDEIVNNLGKMTTQQARDAKDRIDAEEAIKGIASMGYDKWREKELQYKEKKKKDK